jgi:DNA-binding NarL/FixJ family response regulator
MGGKEAVRKILAIAPDARVIVSSGYSSDPVMANYKQYGFTAAIGKPYQLQDLAAGIEMCLQSGS